MCMSTGTHTKLLLRGPDSLHTGRKAKIKELAGASSLRTRFGCHGAATSSIFLLNAPKVASVSNKVEARKNVNHRGNADI